ncbi:MAG: hypothetical protein CMK28_06480 [Porticoccaceae bacterium]|nr:hypothetical protein [Porticoccaceae bacterium]|tara:strand:+ start:81 stop:371 length:291 start_codon:yes stop_codon:yes gene_type:complete
MLLAPSQNANYLFAAICQFFTYLIVMMSPSGAGAIEKADIILSSNRVITMVGEKTSRPLSIAVNGERIAWIGIHEAGKKSEASIFCSVINPFCRTL